MNYKGGVLSNGILLDCNSKVNGRLEQHVGNVVPNKAIFVGNQSSFVLLSSVVETLDILWMSSEDRSGLENVECKTN